MYEKQDGSQYSALRNSRCYLGAGGVLALNNYALRAVGKEVHYPLLGVSSDSVVVKFCCQMSMRDLIKGLGEIHDYQICLKASASSVG